MNRRGVLAAFTAAIGLPVLPGCLHFYTFSGRIEGGRLIVPREQVALLRGPTDVLLVRTDAQVGSIALRRQGDEVVALSTLCTHRGCELNATADSYDCPCHGSRYDLRGEVVEGPAERPLARFQVSPTPDGILITL